MFKKFIVVCVLTSFSLVVFAADDECEAAVDAANRMNPNDDKHCDYSNTGLNGVLHRAFAKKSESASATKSEPANEDSGSASKESAKAAAAEAKALPINSEFTSAQQLQNLRYALVQKTAQECSKGFVVEAERYVPGVKGMTLEFIYHCL